MYSVWLLLLNVYTLLMEHYTCTECHGVSDTPKVCETEGCLKKGQELTTCECTDGQHGGEYEESSYAR